MTSLPGTHGEAEASRPRRERMVGTSFKDALWLGDGISCRDDILEKFASAGLRSD